MNKNLQRYEGRLDSIPKKQIYLNINHLETGKYLLKIVYKNKVIKHITFKK